MGFVKCRYFPWWIDCKVVHGIVSQGSFASLHTNKLSQHARGVSFSFHRAAASDRERPGCKAPVRHTHTHTHCTGSTCWQFVALCVHFRKFILLLLLLPRAHQRKAVLDAVLCGHTVALLLSSRALVHRLPTILYIRA